MSTNKKRIPTPYLLLLIMIVLAALCTWIVPAGTYNTLQLNRQKTAFELTANGVSANLPATQHTLDSLGIHIPLQKFMDGSVTKPVAVPNTYHHNESKKQKLIDVLKAPVQGLFDSVDIILFVLFIRAFMQIVASTGAIDKALTSLSFKLNGKETWLLVLLTFLFSFGGSSYGMAEEGLAFYAVLTPIFVRAGYSAIIPVACIFGGTNLGCVSSFSNPFSTIIASDAAGINWADGINERLILFVITTVSYIVYLVYYANKTRRKPEIKDTVSAPHIKLCVQDWLLILIFFSTFGIMIYGVVALHWWLLEMTVVFFVGSLLAGIVGKIKDAQFVEEFLKGARDLLGVALIIGVARGVTVILNNGQISDTIVHSAVSLLQSFQPWVFIVALFLFYMLLSLVIPSSSGMAVLTMPIVGPIAYMLQISGTEVVNAYLFGIGIMGFITPTGLVFPALSMANQTITTWLKFITPFLIFLIIFCMAWLVIAISF